jgi:hypothetical protein
MSKSFPSAFGKRSQTLVDVASCRERRLMIISLVVLLFRLINPFLDSLIHLSISTSSIKNKIEKDIR